MRAFKPVTPGKSPVSVSLAVSKSMRGNRSSRTQPEIIMSRLLRREISKNNLPGKPEFIFAREKIAIFVHGCFWHRCPRCALKIPRTNREFWRRKFDRNQERDQLVRQELEALSWKVIRIWEHELRRDPLEIRERILKAKMKANVN